jgi:hypothetical protein
MRFVGLFNIDLMKIGIMPLTCYACSRIRRIGDSVCRGGVAKPGFWARDNQKNGTAKKSKK